MSGNDPVWSALLDARLVQGFAPGAGGQDSPWYVKVLLGFSGWLAALFLLGFIGAGLQFIIDSNTASCVTGGLMIGAAFAILRRPGNEFLEHLALAVSLAGQALIVLIIFRTGGTGVARTWAQVALLQAALAAVMPDFVHRVFSAFLAALAFSMALDSMGVPYLFSGVVLFCVAWLWLNEFRYPRHARKLQALAYGLVLALIPLEGPVLFGFGATGWRLAAVQAGSWARPWMGEVLAAAVALYVVWRLLRRRGAGMTDRTALLALTGTLLLCAVSMEADGLTAGMVIVLLGFAGGNRVLLGLGVVALLLFISSYYYLLDATLLDKAQTLLAAGLALLVLRWLLLRIMPGETGARRVG